MAGKQFQLASDGFWQVAYSGVIKSDGTWCPCAHGNEDWQDYMDWYGQSVDNRADPWLSPADGGVAIKLKEGEVPVGTMFDSLPPDWQPAPVKADAPPKTQVAVAPPPAHVPPPLPAPESTKPAQPAPAHAPPPPPAAHSSSPPPKK